MRKLVVSTLFAMACGLMACGDSGTSDNGDTDTAVTGVEVSGNWSGTLTEEKSLRVSIFECPFSMPPRYFFEGTADPTTGDVHASWDNVAPGDWCLMAYIDMDSGDGYAPVAGLDPVNNTGDENTDGGLPITVVAGQVTSVVLEFAVR